MIVKEKQSNATLKLSLISSFSTVFPESPTRLSSITNYARNRKLRWWNHEFLAYKYEIVFKVLRIFDTRLINILTDSFLKLEWVTTTEGRLILQEKFCTRPKSSQCVSCLSAKKEIYIKTSGKKTIVVRTPCSWLIYQVVKIVHQP